MKMAELVKRKKQILDFLKQHKLIYDDDIPILMEYIKIIESGTDPHYMQESWNRVKYDIIAYFDNWRDGEDQIISCERIFHKGFTEQQIIDGLKGQAETLLSFMGSNRKVRIKIKSIETTDEIPGKIQIQMKKGYWDWETYPKE